MIEFMSLIIIYPSHADLELMMGLTLFTYMRYYSFLLKAVYRYADCRLVITSTIRSPIRRQHSCATYNCFTHLLKIRIWVLSSLLSLSEWGVKMRRMVRPDPKCPENDQIRLVMSKAVFNILIISY